MSKTETKTTAEPKLVPVISRASCLRYFAKPRKPGAKACEEVMIAPGLNLVREDDLEAIGVGKPGVDPFAVSRGSLRVADPITLDDHVAIEIALATCSRFALNAWRTKEERPDVIEAIDSRLALRRVA